MTRTMIGSGFSVMPREGISCRSAACVPRDQEMQVHTLRDRAGGVIEQLRTVAMGSNWPAQAPGRPPRPGVVAVQRRNGQPLLEG